MSSLTKQRLLVLSLSFATVGVASAEGDCWNYETESYEPAIEDRYDGEWLNGLRHGYGVSICPNGDRYEGEWRNNEEHGRGTATWGAGRWKGDRYDGDWVEGERTGKGIYYLASGTRYEGEFKAGRAHGKGSKTFGPGEWEGQRYVGHYLNGEAHGKGIFYWPSGNRYEGDWVEGERTGKGIFYWTSGDRYEGDYVKDKPHGEGTYYWPSGNRYEGDWVEGDRTGKGTFYWAYGKFRGDRYEGDFVKGDRTGKGIYYWANGSSYEGDFVRGKIRGIGIHYLFDGSRYEGQWGKGGRRGGGIEYTINGKAYIQEWKGDSRRVSSVAAAEFFPFLRLLNSNSESPTISFSDNYCNRSRLAGSIADGILVWDSQKNRYLSADGRSNNEFFEELAQELKRLDKECQRGAAAHGDIVRANESYKSFLRKYAYEFKWQVNYNKQLLADKAYEASLISVTIDSTPVPSTLFVDDQVEGETPQNLRLEPRTYTIRLKQGDLDRTVTIDPREKSNHTISLIDPEEEQRKANEAKKRQQEKEAAEKRIAEKERLRREQEMSLSFLLKIKK